MNDDLCCTCTVSNRLPPSPLSGRANRLDYWSRRKRELEKKLPKWIPRAARTRRAPCRENWYERPMIEILLTESIIRVSDMESLKQFCAGEESRRRRPGVPSFDRKY